MTDLDPNTTVWHYPDGGQSSSGPMVLDDLGDVTVLNPQDDQYLVYSQDQWRNTASSAGGVTGPGSSVIDNFASFASSTGQVIKDSLLNSTSFTPISHVGSAGAAQHALGDAVTAGFFLDAVSDGNQYARQDGAWAIVVGGGGGGDVSGPAGGVVDDEITSFSGTTGKIIKGSSGKLAANAVDNISTAIADNIPVFDGATGRRIKDGLISSASFAPASHVGSGGGQHAQVTGAVDGFMIAADKTKLDGVATGAQPGDVVGPAVAVDSNFAGFDATTGKLIKDSGNSAGDFTPASHVGSGGAQHADVIAAGASGFMTGADKTKLNGIADGAQPGDVVGPAGGVVDQEIALFDATTGKLIQGSGGALLSDYAKQSDLLGYVLISTEDTLAGQMEHAVVAALPGTPDANTIYFVKA